MLEKINLKYYNLSIEIRLRIMYNHRACSIIGLILINRGVQRLVFVGYVILIILNLLISIFTHLTHN